MFFDKPVNDLTFEDVVQFCQTQRPEGKQLDYKYFLPKNKEKFAKTIASFANALGGTVIIGVNDDKNDKPKAPFTGIPYHEKMRNTIEDIIQTYIDPIVFVDVNTCVSKDGQRMFVVVNIPQSNLTPHLVGKLKRAYIRTGQSSRPEVLVHPDRLPWLLIGMLGGIGNSMILGNFDTTFAAHPEMALYIPLIGGTGGNVGTQSSAIIVQGLANSSLDAKNTFRQVAKESVVAAINATIISLLVYIYNFIRFGATATVTYSVSISLFAVVMFASIFGTLVPMTLEKLKVDPAIATGPFISITNDIIGMMLYMGITVLLS